MANVSLKHFKATTVSAVMMVSAMSGPLIVFLFLGEAPSLFTLIGGTVILAGIAWYMVQERSEARQFERQAAADGGDL